MPQNDNRTHYQVLGVSTDASRQVIKQAFVTLALQTHPDKQQSPLATSDSSSSKSSSINCLKPSFERIQAAWDCLQDSQQRKKYNQELYLHNQQQQTMRQSAIVICIDDCHVDGNDNAEVCLYTCRCGQELDVQDEVNDLLHCKTCSLVYDTSHIFQDDN
jgi:DnaJ-class molecular chaperone